MIMVDDRDRAARLDAALRAHGCSYVESTTFLALTWPTISPAPGPARLEVARTGAGDLETWARVKLQSFADSEDAPAADAVAAEAAARCGELPLADYQLGILDGEPVSVLVTGWACGWCFEDWREVIGVKSKEVKQGGE